MTSNPLPAFRPGDPRSGYYNDQRGAALRPGGSPADAIGSLRRMSVNRASAMPVGISQIGLGAWQLSRDEPAWRSVVAHAAHWIVDAADENGLLAHLSPLPHTYELPAPWYSAMAQGEAASLLVRAADTLEDDSLATAAVRVVMPLADAGYGLIVNTADGPVLQEYVTHPPSHVLNGWISALWGLYDVSLGTHEDGSGGTAARFADCFEKGVDALAARLPMYRIGRDWSRYDLFPHPIPNVASPFYHRLHVEQLAALDRLAPRAVLRKTSDEWARALGHPLTIGAAVASKVAFRVIRPRSRWIRVPWGLRRAG